MSSKLAGAPAWMQGLAAIGTLVISVLVALRLIPDSPLNPSPAGSITPQMVEEALARSVVQVQMLSGGEMVGWGSGTVISEDGLILTNAHVATPSDVELDDLIIAVTQQADTPPEPGYHAEVVAADSVLDLAIIRITTNMGGGPYDGALEPIPIGDSDDVSIGDELIILGYPSVGGDTITLTYGHVSGFTANPTLGSHAWIKTDATILGGNSGGLAANSAGELVGVPTQLGAGDTGEIVDCRVVTDTNGDLVINDEDECIPLGGFLNSLRPINLARDMLAAIEAGTAYQPIGDLPDPVDDPNPEPGGFDVDGVSFDRLSFLDVQPPDDADFTPDDDPVWLGSGATALCAWWEYSGMANGVTYSAVWGLDGEIQESISYIDEVWIGDETGAWWVCVTNNEGVTEGIWDLELSVEGSLISGSFVSLGDDLAPNTLTLNNDGPETICYLQISPTTSTFWGADWLGAEQTIPPNEGVTLPLPPYTYDLRGLDCDLEDIFVDQQEILADTELTY
jgi:S1-C subfamily serine protease